MSWLYALPSRILFYSPDFYIYSVLGAVTLCTVGFHVRWVNADMRRYLAESETVTIRREEPTTFTHPLHGNVGSPPPVDDGQDCKDRAQELERRDVVRNVQFGVLRPEHHLPINGSTSFDVSSHFYYISVVGMVRGGSVVVIIQYPGLPASSDASIHPECRHVQIWSMCYDTQD